MKRGQGQGESRTASGQLYTPYVGAERSSPSRYPPFAPRSNLDILLIPPEEHSERSWTT